VAVFHFSSFVACLAGPAQLDVQQDCPNGRLTPAKFVDMYKMFFPNGNAEEFCDHVFRTFDMDKNGFIDFKVSIFSLLMTFC
jgi:Ca2+-binding EF-hand superfamily protein